MTKFAKKNRETILPQKQAHLLNDFIAVILFAMALVVAGMLATYSSNDTSWFKASDTIIISNKFGPLGANISDIIFSILGGAGWWLVIGIFYLGYRKIVRKQISSGNWFTIFQTCCFIAIILSSTILEYICFYSKAHSPFHDGYGGVVGRFLFNLIAAHTGAFSVSIAMLAILLFSFILVFGTSILLITEYAGFAIEYLVLGVLSVFEQKPKLMKDSDEDHTEEFTHELVNDHVGALFANDASDVVAVNGGISLDKIDQNEINIVEESVHSNTDSLFESPWDDEVTENTSTDGVADFFKRRVSKKVAVQYEDELELGLEKALPQKGKIKLTGILPTTILLNNPPLQPVEKISNETLEYVSSSIENKLAEFGVEAKIVHADTGPVITRYELLPSRGVRGEKIVGLGKEIARGLALTNVRIVETIPGKNSMGIEVPNFKRQVIYLKEIFDSEVYKRSTSKLTLALGKDIAGNVVVTDLAKMPHLLVAGTTGSGKSVAVNAMILSILFQATPDEVKFIMIDPKMVELSFYADIPHLLAPVVTDMTQAGNALRWTVGEMEMRYRIMAKLGCKNIVSFNQKISDAAAAGEEILNPFSASSETPEVLSKWPFIVVIIDELADLMMVTGKKTEQYIARIAQKARAIGIHLIVATQRPSVDVITGLIKANIPARISFQVSSKIDSRTILDQMGAEALLGQGDMLFLQPGSGFPNRIHGAFVNDDELTKVVEFLKNTGKPDYINEILTGESDVEIPGIESDSINGEDPEKDSMFDEAVKFIYDSKRCSISSLQTRFGIGYNRAARIMNHLEKIGMVKRNDRGGFEILRNPQE